jgi:hypothetical protein
MSVSCTLVDKSSPIFPRKRSLAERSLTSCGLSQIMAIEKMTAPDEFEKTLENGTLEEIEYALDKISSALATLRYPSSTGILRVNEFLTTIVE